MVTVGDGVLVAVGEGVSVAVGVLVAVGEGVSVAVGVLVAVGDGVSVSVSSRNTCPLIVLPLADRNPVLAYAEVVYRKMHIKEQQTKETASIQAI